MLNEIILHIGMPKTGTSSIQNALLDFDDGNVFYAKLPDTNHGKFICTAFQSNPEEYHFWRRRGSSKERVFKMRDLYRQKISAQMHSRANGTMILSGEDMSAMGHSDVQLLADFLHERTKNVRVVCYVRDPVSYAASAFQQMVKVGLSEVPEKVDPRYRFRLEKFVDTFGAENVSVRDFSKNALKDGDIVSDFASELECVFPDSDRANESMSAGALKVLYLFNRKNPVSTGDRLLMHARRALMNLLMARLPHSDDRIPKALFSPLANYDDLDYLDSAFGIQFPANMLSDMTREDLSSWLDETSEEMLSQVNAILDSFDISGNFTTISQKINRIYYHLLIQSDGL